MNGFGSPSFVYFLYAFKLVVYFGGAMAVISLTPGLGSLGDFSEWWSEPIVFQKFAVWTLLWEILGLGAGSMPLSFRFNPPIGGPLYWLRPGTVRLPPWPDRVPLTAGSYRTPVDNLALRGRPRHRPLPPPRWRDGRVRNRRRPFAQRRDHRAARLAGRPGPAGQGLVPRRPSRDLRPDPGGFAVRPGPVDRGLAVRPAFHLVGRRLVEAQQALSVRRLNDGEQRAARPAAVRQAAYVAELSGRHAAVARAGALRPLWDGSGVPAGRCCYHGRQRGRPDGGDRRNDPLPREHRLDVPARGPARVERLHDLRDRLPVRALRRRPA